MVVGPGLALGLAVFLEAHYWGNSCWNEHCGKTRGSSLAHREVGWVQAQRGSRGPRGLRSWDEPELLGRERRCVFMPLPTRGRVLGMGRTLCARLFSCAICVGGSQPKDLCLGPSAPGGHVRPADQESGDSTGFSRELVDRITPEGGAQREAQPCNNLPCVG